MSAADIPKSTQRIAVVGFRWCARPRETNAEALACVHRNRLGRRGFEIGVAAQASDDASPQTVEPKLLVARVQ